jgi:hypothetical protein
MGGPSLAGSFDLRTFGPEAPARTDSSELRRAIWDGRISRKIPGCALPAGIVKVPLQKERGLSGDYPGGSRGIPVCRVVDGGSNRGAGGPCPGGFGRFCATLYATGLLALPKSLCHITFSILVFHATGVGGLRFFPSGQSRTTAAKQRPKCLKPAVFRPSPHRSPASKRGQPLPIAAKGGKVSVQLVVQLGTAGVQGPEPHRWQAC